MHALSPLRRMHALCHIAKFLLRATATRPAAHPRRASAPLPAPPSCAAICPAIVQSDSRRASEARANGPESPRQHRRRRRHCRCRRPPCDQPPRWASPAGARRRMPGLAWTSRRSSTRYDWGARCPAGVRRSGVRRSVVRRAQLNPASSFQVGKKLPRAQNQTDTSFKSRTISLVRPPCQFFFFGHCFCLRQPAVPPLRLCHASSQRTRCYHPASLQGRGLWHAHRTGASTGFDKVCTSAGRHSCRRSRAWLSTERGRQSAPAT